MARQCAIVVQRCAQAREGEEEGGVLGQLGKSIILVASLKDFSDQKVVVFGLKLTTGWVCGSSVVRHRLSVTLSGESESDDQL